MTDRLLTISVVLDVIKEIINSKQPNTTNSCVNRYFLYLYHPLMTIINFINN